MKVKEESKLKKIISYGISFICLILCIFITVEVISASNDSRPPRIFGYSLSYVPTGSMEPKIMAGDYVIYKKATMDDCGYDDIIVYRNEDGLYVIHRIIEDNGDYFVVKGDNNVIEDAEVVTADNIYAKYVCTVGALSVFSGGISKNAIFFILIIIFIIMIIMQIVSIVVKEKADKITKDTETEKELLLQQMRNQILQEELEKLRNKSNENN